MHDWVKEQFFNPELERQRINIHQYCDNDNVRTVWKMDDLYHPIRFSTALTLTLTLHNYDVKMGSGLAACTKIFLVFQPGYWPCQFYSREIMYESLKKFVSCCSHPVLTSTLDGHD